MSASTAPSARRIAVRYFASIREALGTGSETVSTAAATAGALRDELIARGGAHAAALDRARPVRIAVDQVMSPESQPLADGAEVAFFPPVTGG
jgi:molybdopterin synthase sulfur carrier subunit